MDPVTRSSGRVREAFDRNARVLARRPLLGCGTATTTVRLLGGLACEIEEAGRRLVCDMPEKHGGTDAGPNPGFLGRGALGACLAMGVARWAARAGIRLDGLEVSVEADYDAGGEFAVSDVRPGYESVRVVAAVDTDADESVVRSLFDKVDRHTSFLDLFRNGTLVTTELRFAGEREASR